MFCNCFQTNNSKFVVFENSKVQCSRIEKPLFGGHGSKWRSKLLLDNRKQNNAIIWVLNQVCLLLAQDIKEV